MKNTVKKIVALVPVIVIAFLYMLSIDAQGSNDSEMNKKEYYHELENRYKEVLVSVLEDDGYFNAGITITSVIRKDGARDYSVMIHHDRFEHMSQQDVDTYAKRLEDISFPDNKSSITCLLVYDI